MDRGPDIKERPAHDPGFRANRKALNGKLVISAGAIKHDFGQLTHGQRVTHRFEMRAGGEFDLFIFLAKPTRRSVQVELFVEDEKGAMLPWSHDDPSRPGRKILLVATFDPSLEQGQTSVRINVYSNDPVGLHQLELRADVQPLLNLSPPGLLFGDVAPYMSSEQHVDIRVTSGERLLLYLSKATRMSPVPAGLQLSLAAIEPDVAGRSSHWRMSAKLGPGVARGYLDYPIVLESDLRIPGGKRDVGGALARYGARIGVSAHVQVLTCKRLQEGKGTIPSASDWMRSVLLKSFDPDFEFQNVTVRVIDKRGGEIDWDQYFSYEVRPVPGVSAVEIDLHMRRLPKQSRLPYSALAIIETGHPQEPEVHISLIGRLRGRFHLGRPLPKGSKRIPARSDD